MSERPRAIYAATGRRRRRPPIGLLLALALMALAAAWLVDREGGADEAQPAPPPLVRLSLEGREVIRMGTAEIERSSAAVLRRRLRGVPANRRERRGRAVVDLETDYGATVRVMRRLARSGGGTAPVVDRSVSASISIPVVKQKLRNNCESAALSMLLLTKGERAEQLALQRELPRSGPLDPRVTGDGPTIWGDPREGFVGRPDGGGTSGGYGVYDGPVAALARRRGVAVTNLSGRPPARIYDALRNGRAVMVWIGLSDGPFRTWRTPSGRSVTGNFGEHTVVLTGIRDGRLTVNDPLSGNRLTWTKPQFELMWERLGERALAA